MQLAHIKTFQAIKLDKEGTYFKADENTSIRLDAASGLIHIQTAGRTVITSVANLCWAEELKEDKETKNGQDNSSPSAKRTPKKAKGKTKVERA